MNQTLDVQKEKLMQDLRVVMRDAEDLLKSSGQQLGDGAALWRERTQDRLTQVREQLNALQQQTTDRAVAASRSANEFVHRNPWAAVGVASGVGLLAGYLMSSRR
ncbi:MAG: DUF883 domain-containing protein [Betaproteobacteria bacterium]|jgi:ElaB/YqjD/DUF883 family membrane-anchored ribosome-binding protein|nr:DUF883 domain-containing protein [Betaproteobacteria bacterium]NBT10460.1 DUF883 domain-containing protein [Betaproteobacteria bacterium]NBU48890.1 DUF883 domain-containing protein [Betaproteobacteria bacterium]